MHLKVLRALGLVLLGTLLGGGAWAASSGLTSKDIKDESIQNRDIRKGVISLNRLTPAVQDLIHEGGPQGPPGGPGAPGAPGAPGGSAGPTLSSGNFGVENRNTTGSPVAQLRLGPNGPPLGTGSLNLLVAKGEKVAYGITVSGSVSNIKEAGFRVNTTGENTAAGLGSVNMPSITFEIDPNLSSLPNTNYSSLVWTPAANSASNKWSPYLDATTSGSWGLTGSAFNNPATQANCGINGPRCTLAQVKAALDDGGDGATIFTLAVAKGTDFAWQGAVDGLRVNGRVADFEEGGVVIKNA